MNKTKLADTDKRLVVLPEGKGGRGSAKWVKELECVVRNENLTFAGEHTIVYTDIELQCCTPETYILL